VKVHAVKKEGVLDGAEWTRTTRIERVFGISRSTQYTLGERGEITLSRHRRPGAKQSLVLVNVPSVKRYLARGVVTVIPPK
jgi:hypothetical protein